MKDIDVAGAYTGIGKQQQQQQHYFRQAGMKKELDSAILV